MLGLCETLLELFFLNLVLKMFVPQLVLLHKALKLFSQFFIIRSLENNQDPIQHRISCAHAPLMIPLPVSVCLPLAHRFSIGHPAWHRIVAQITLDGASRQNISARTNTSIVALNFSSCSRCLS
jgi:hypothetical protein